MRLVSSAEMAEIDRRSQAEYRLPGIVLMENAGRGALELLRAELGLRPPVVFVAGKGNNAGDAFVMARHALLAGIRPLAIVLAAGDPREGSEPAVNLASCRALGIEVLALEQQEARDRLRAASWIVDGLAGTGLSGPLRAPLAAAVDAVNSSAAATAAVDLPSGLRDGYRPGEPAVRARVTLTMGLPKRCLYLPAARALCGQIRVVDPGFPPALLCGDSPAAELLADGDLESLVPPLEADTYKNRRGHLAVFAGSAGTTGAAWLASSAAARSRTGLVTLHAHPDIYGAVAGSYHSIMVRPESPDDADPPRMERYTAFLAGPGWGRTAERRGELLRLLRSPLPGVLDADAIVLAAEILEAEGVAPGPSRILTPHPGEFGRLTGRPAAEALIDPLEALRDAGKRYGGPIVLKSHATIVWSPGDRYAVLDGMNPALATGGSGDVLAGVIAGLLASGLSPETAARAGVLAHARAAALAVAARGLIISEDLLPFVSQALRFCCGGAE